MKIIEILLQGEHIPDIQLVTLETGKCVRDLLIAAAQHRKSNLDDEFFVFEEGCETHLAEDDILPECEDGQPLRYHVHRCHHITVTVTFNGIAKEHEFGPGTTIAKVKRWAAEKAFGMDAGDADEHVLQLSGTSDRPEPDTHIGSLVTFPDCSLTFDLVPLKRVEG